MPDPFVHRLEQLVDREHVLVDPDQVASYTTDWTGRWSGDCLCVVRPGSAAEVSLVLTACAEAGVAVVPQGGNTGLVGGAVPTDGAVVLSTQRLDEIGEVDEAGRLLVGAGATLATVAAAAEAAGWEVGVDIASRDSATIGGMVATDAGGARVIANGSMRQRVLGLEAVLPDGTVARPWLRGLAKDTAGYDLRHVLVGSEGTLAVITGVLLQLVRPAPTTASVLLMTPLAELPSLLRRVQDTLAASAAYLTAAEFMTRAGARLAAEALDTVSPVDDEAALLVDLAGPVDLGLLERLATLSSTDAIPAVEARGRARLWALREAHTEAISQLGVPVKLDVAVPLPRLGEFLEQARAIVAQVLPHATTVLFGHAAEGNVHVNVPGATDHADAIEEAVYEVVDRLGGTVSAEHGIGRAKVDHLHRTRDASSIAAMRSIKDALDPDRLLNPGVLLPAEVR